MTGKAQTLSTSAQAGAALPGDTDYESLYRQAIADNQARDEELALLAHELRNPLNALSTSSEVLKRSVPGSALAVSAAKVIARQIRKLADLIDLRLSPEAWPPGPRDGTVDLDVRVDPGPDTATGSDADPTTAAPAGQRRESYDSLRAAPSDDAGGVVVRRSIAAGFEERLAEPVEPGRVAGLLGAVASRR